MTGIIILAAGQSKRMGTPKQQLAFKDTSLLEHAIATAVASKAGIVAVILGFEAAALQPAMHNNKLHVIVNEAWATGMGSSVSTGMQWLLKTQPAMAGILIMLCDQPFVTTGLLNDLISKKANSDKNIIASSYANTVGVPALFGQKYFTTLATLQGETGARKILQQHENDVATISFPEGAIDVDTMEDYNRL